MSKKDYYDTLGVNKHADDKTIKQAYRKLAKKYHPDMNQGNKEAEQKFKEVTEAYNVLSDEEKKKMYDQYGFAAFDENAANKGNYQEYHFTGSNMNDIFDDLFGNVFHTQYGNRDSGFYSGYGGSYNRSRTATRRGMDTQSNITISLEEAAFGCDKVIQIKNNKNTSSLQVHIPAGIEEGKSIRLREKGQPGYGGGQPGDLLLKVHICEKVGYERKGTDLYTTAKIPYVTAVLGGEVQVPTLYGDVICKVPAGSQSGSKIRLRGKGMPSMKNPSVRGDQYVSIQIQVPRNLTNEAKEKLKEFARLVS